ncbi:MAG: DUF2953 domain-containing protein [Acetatifactor sp.]
MGGIILGLLRGIGIIFLILMAALLLLLLIVLFDPITYRVRGEKSPEVLFCRVKVNWLFGIIRFRLIFDEKLQTRLYLLWFDLLKKQKLGGGEIEKDSAPETVNPSDVLSEGIMPEHGSSQEENSSEDQTDRAGTERDSASDSSSGADPTTQSSAEGKKKSFFQKVRDLPDTIRGIRDKISDIWNNITEYKELLEDPNTKQLWKKGKDSLLRILKAICPGRCEGRILYGTGSPDTTGYLYGVYGLLSPKLGKRFTVEPDFQETVLEGEVRIRGRIFLITLLVNGLSVLCRKELRIFLKQIKLIQTKTRR